MITLKSDSDIENIRKAGKILSSVLDKVEKLIKPGISRLDIDKLVHEEILSKGAIPSFLGYNGFPNAACISVNDEVIHGIPNNEILVEGDIVGVDIGVTFNDYISDSCRTFAVGEISKDAKQLLDVTEKALYAAIDVAIEGNRIKDIGKAVSSVVKPFGYGIVTTFCGHGVGFEVHEEPQIPNNWPSRGPNPRLKKGMVLAIEPMINMGSSVVDIDDDEWTVRTVDNSLSAHFEHTIAVMENHADILTR